MTNELYACICAEEFPAQALLRLRTDLAVQPVAILDGKPPLQTVCSFNRSARIKGVALGMTRLECETLVGLHCLPRSIETELAAQSVLLESAAQFSPRIEAVESGSDFGCILDIAGSERLFGSPDKLASRIKDALATSGLRVSVAVSANFHTARLKAFTSHGITIIPQSHEPVALSKLPVEVLALPQEAAETLAIWGIRTLGELAALPEADTVARLGQQARDWRKLASGELGHTFQPMEENFALQEHCAFESAVEEIDSLLFVGARMIDCLITRAAGRALSLAELNVSMRLDGGAMHQRTVRPALPTTDRKFLLKLLQLEIAAHPPQAGVLSLTLSAQPGQSSKVQLGLFAPQTPEPSRLDVTLARLKAIAGDDRVGSPVLEDTHKPGSFRMEDFHVAGNTQVATHDAPSATRMALRRMRPPSPVQVWLDAQRPVTFFDRQQRFRVRAAYGPWRTSGCWWSADSWNTEEWDVLAEGNQGAIACLLVHDCTRRQWQLEAIYD